MPCGYRPSTPGSGYGQPPHYVSEAGRWLALRPAIRSLRKDSTQPAAGPEGRPVVTAFFGVGALRSLAGTSGDYERGVPVPEVGYVDFQPATDRGQVVGEEHVGRFDDLHERLVAVGMGHVDGQ